MADATSKLMRGLLEVMLLEAIAREPQHGYALIRDLEEVFGQPPNRNQVYPLLNRLEREGYLHADRREGRGKTRYALTGKGLELLKEYRLRTAPFRARIQGLWLPETLAERGASGPSEGGAPDGEEPETGKPASPGETRAAPQPHLLDLLAPEGEEPPLPAGEGHAGQPCRAELALRRRPGEDRLAFEAARLDPSCPVCGDAARALRALRDRWFSSA